jgi:hypothetical protein
LAQKKRQEEDDARKRMEQMNLNKKNLPQAYYNKYQDDKFFNH